MSKSALYGYIKKYATLFDGLNGDVFGASRRNCKLIGYDGHKNVLVLIYRKDEHTEQTIVSRYYLYNHRGNLFSQRQLNELPDLKGSYRQRKKVRYQFVLMSGSRGDTDDLLFMPPRTGNFLPRLQKLIEEGSVAFPSFQKTSYSNRKIHLDNSKSFGRQVFPEVVP